MNLHGPITGQRHWSSPIFHLLLDAPVADRAERFDARRPQRRFWNVFGLFGLEKSTSRFYTATAGTTTEPLGGLTREPAEIKNPINHRTKAIARTKQTSVSRVIIKATMFHWLMLKIEPRQQQRSDPQHGQDDFDGEHAPEPSPTGIAG
jgi:hypothetical protein